MVDTVAASLVRAALATLRQDSLRSITDDSTRIHLDHVTRLLRAVEARLSSREAGLRNFVALAEPLAGIVAPQAGGDREVLEERRRRAEEAMCRRLPELLGRAAVDSTCLGTLRALVEAERAFFVSQDPDVTKGFMVVHRGGRIDEEEPSGPGADAVLDATSLSDYVRRRTGRNDLYVTDVQRVPGGFSKETSFFSLTDAASASSQRLVMRKDLSPPLLGKSVVNEYGLLRKLFDNGFPVAEPLWLESDAQLFAGAFIVSRRVSGSSNAALWANDPARAATACLDLARWLARLHTFEPAQLGFEPSTMPRNAGEAMEREIAYWTRLFYSKRQEAFPLQEMPLVWLARNIPRQLYDRPARVVHADAGFHNLMMDDAGSVTALLDWEFAGLGDPTQDLCFIREFIERLIPWPDFVAAYRQAGGEAPCDEAEFFYRLWTVTRNAVGCVDSQTLFDTVRPGETRFALAGHIFAPYMFLAEATMLIEHLSQE